MPYKDPEKRREMRARQRQAKKAARASAAGSAPGVHGVSQGATGAPIVAVYHAPEVAALRIRTAADVLTLLEGQAAAVLADVTVETCARARTLGYLAGVMLRAVETADLTARLEAIEEALAARGDTATGTNIRRFAQ